MKYILQLLFPLRSHPARYIAAPLPSAASSSCSTAPAEQSCPHCHQQQQQRCPHCQQQSCPPPPAAEAGAPPLPAPAPPPAPVLAPVPPHHHFTCCHPGRCHYHPHGSHGQNQAAAAIEEAGGDKEDKVEPYKNSYTYNFYY